LQLEEEKIQKLKVAFSEFPVIQEAILYGSRALDRARVGSDIDISLKGKIQLTDQLQLMNQVDEFYWPIKVDFSIFSEIQNPDLINHIETFGISIYKKDESVDL